MQRTLCHCEASTGDPAGYCVPVGKRNKQAKDKQLSLATIVWSKVKFMTRDVRISRKGILVAFGSDMPTARYCFRSDIVFDSDICTAGKLWINTLALMKPKYNLHCKYNRSCPRCTIYDD